MLNFRTLNSNNTRPNLWRVLRSSWKSVLHTEFGDNILKPVCC